MADNLPAPESRVESYLAKAAGEDVTIPEKPLSRTEQYLAAIAEGGGGGGGSINVINNLESTSTTDALSANMGRELNNLMYDFTSFKLFTEYSGEPNMPMNSENPDGYNAFIDPNTIFYSTYDDPIKLYYSETDYIDNFVGYVLSNLVKEDELDGSQYFSFVIIKNVENGSAEIYVGETKNDATEGRFINLSFTQVGAGGGGETYTDLATLTLDYPTNNPTGIAGWNLPVGTYYVSGANSVNLYTSTSSFYQMDSQHTITVGQPINGVMCITIESNTYSGDIHEYYCHKNSLTQPDGTYITDHFFITNREVIDNFISYATQVPLSANRGRLLYNMITPTTDASAPTTSTQGELGKIFIDTTNDDAYMCVKASGGTYTWKKITP